MKKIQLFIFTMLSIITFSNSNIVGPKLFVGGGIGFGTQYIIEEDRISFYSMGLDLDANVGPVWIHKIDEKNSIDFGPSISLSLRNHKNAFGYILELFTRANMSFDYNLKTSEKVTFYLGAKAGIGAYTAWIVYNKMLLSIGDAILAGDIDLHTGVKLDNDTLRLGISAGTRGLILEVGKIF